MTRQEKINLLQAIAAGKSPTDLLDPLAQIVTIFFEETDNLYHCTGIPKSWGFPERLTRQQVNALHEKIDQYRNANKGLGLPPSIIVTYDPPDPQHEPIKD